MQRAFTRERQFVFRRLAVNHEARANRLLVGRLRANRVPLLAYQKQQPGENACPAQLLRRQNLCCNNPLRVARSAPVNTSVIFGRCNERRHRIHVGGKNNFRTIMPRPSGSTFARAPSTGIFRASIPRRRSSSQRKSPTALSFGVTDSMSIKRRASANRSMQKKSSSG